MHVPEEERKQWGPVLSAKTRAQLREDFTLFAEYQLECRASDAEYPLLEVWYKKKEYSSEAAHWRSIVFVAFCNLHSMYEFCETYLSPVANHSGPVCFLPTGVERRGHRGGRVRYHLDDWFLFLKKYGSFENFLKKDFTENKKRNWHVLQENILEVWGNGRWAAYKLAETLYTVHHYPVEPTDMGNAYSSGPRKGLSMLFEYVPGNTKEAIARLDQQGEELMRWLNGKNIYLGIEKMETMLCDFHSMAVGHCYSGHDIDVYQEQLLRSTLTKAQKDFIWEVRREALPNEFLGELHGWVGVEKMRHKAYHQTGKVLKRTEPVSLAYRRG